MIKTNKTDIITCTFRRVRFALFASSLCTPRISTQKEVVSAVNAESALLKAAAMIPIVKKIKILPPKIPEVQNIGRISSLRVGNWMFRCAANVSSSTPSARNKKLTGVKANPYVYIFFWASFKLLQERFFCIMS